MRKYPLILILLIFSCLLPLAAFAEEQSGLQKAIEQLAEQVINDSKTRILQEVADSIQVTYVNSQYPKNASAGQTVNVELTVKNTSGNVWKKDGVLSTYFSYVWTDHAGNVIAEADEGSVSLPYNVDNDQLAQLKFSAAAPENYTGWANLQIKLVTLSSPLGQLEGIAPYNMKIKITKPGTANTKAPAPAPIKTDTAKANTTVKTDTVKTDTVKSAAGSYVISGRGYGHGIGLSQWGARGMALQGSNYQDILAHYYQGSTVQSNTPERPIRAAVALSQNTAKVTPGAAYRLIDLVSNEILAEGEANDEWSFSTDGTKIKAELNNTSFSSTQFLLESDTHLTLNNQKKYHEAFIIRTNNRQTFDVINQLDLENYLLGVISKEIPASFPEEAIKAQAVASRSYARHRMKQNAAKSFDVYPSEISQVYAGINGETAAGTAAVNATKYQVAAYNGEIIEALFFSNSGGHTESNENVWNSAPIPYLRGVPDEYSGYQADPVSSRYGIWWSKAYTREQLSQLFKVGNVLDIQVSEAYPSGRPAKIKVTGSENTAYYTANEFRKLLDPNGNIFRSSWFMIEKK